MTYLLRKKVKNPVELEPNSVPNPASISVPNPTTILCKRDNIPSMLPPLLSRNTVPDPKIIKIPDIFIPPVNAVPLDSNIYNNLGKYNHVKTKLSINLDEECITSKKYTIIRKEDKEKFSKTIVAKSTSHSFHNLSLEIPNDDFCVNLEKMLVIIRKEKINDALSVVREIMILFDNLSESYMNLNQVERNSEMWQNMRINLIYLLYIILRFDIDDLSKDAFPNYNKKYNIARESDWENQLKQDLDDDDIIFCKYIQKSFFVMKRQEMVDEFRLNAKEKYKQIKKENCPTFKQTLNNKVCSFTKGLEKLSDESQYISYYENELKIIDNHIKKELNDKRTEFDKVVMPISVPEDSNLAYVPKIQRIKDNIIDALDFNFDPKKENQKRKKNKNQMILNEINVVKDLEDGIEEESVVKIVEKDKIIHSKKIPSICLVPEDTEDEIEKEKEVTKMIRKDEIREDEIIKIKQENYIEPTPTPPPTPLSVPPPTPFPDPPHVVASINLLRSNFATNTVIPYVPKKQYRVRNLKEVISTKQLPAPFVSKKK
jgi:hypothetical protein